MGNFGCCSSAHELQHVYNPSADEKRKAFLILKSKPWQPWKSGHIPDEWEAGRSPMINDRCGANSVSNWSGRSNDLNEETNFSRDKIALLGGSNGQKTDGRTPIFEPVDNTSAYTDYTHSRSPDLIPTKGFPSLSNWPILKSSSEAGTIVHSPRSWNTFATVSAGDDVHSAEEFEMDNLPAHTVKGKKACPQSGLLKKNLLPYQFESYRKSDDDIKLQSTGAGGSLTELLRSINKLGITDDEKRTLVAPGSYRSLVANEVESEFSPNGGECYGIMPWNLCWLRGDGGTIQTDYNETMLISESLLTPNGQSAAPKYPKLMRKELRILKKALANAYIEAVPSCRRQLSLITIAVDSIWKEVTSTSEGKVVLQQDLYIKELAWLRARKKKTVDGDNEKSLLRQSTNRAKNFLYDKGGIKTPSMEATFFPPA